MSNSQCICDDKTMGTRVCRRCCWEWSAPTTREMRILQCIRHSHTIPAGFIEYFTTFLCDECDKEYHFKTINGMITVVKKQCVCNDETMMESRKCLQCLVEWEIPAGHNIRMSKCPYHCMNICMSLPCFLCDKCGKEYKIKTEPGPLGKATVVKK